MAALAKLVHGWSTADSIMWVCFAWVPEHLPEDLLREHLSGFGQVFGVGTGMDSAFPKAYDGRVEVTMLV